MKTKTLYILIGILVVLNIFSITTFWLGAFDKRHDRPLPPRGAPEEIIAAELGLSQGQMEQFRELRKEHQRSTEIIFKEIHGLKSGLFDEVFVNGDSSKRAEEIIKQISLKQEELERSTYKHFSKLASICRPDQREKLRMFLRDIGRHMIPGNIIQAPPPPPMK